MVSGQIRVIIENVTPEIDNGKFYAKRVVNEYVNVEADIFGDGHDVVNAHLLYKHEKDKKWTEMPMHELVNDRWQGSFQVKKQGYYFYTIEAWIDHALNWQHNIERKIEDEQTVEVELLDGVQYLKMARKKASAAEKAYLDELIKSFADKNSYKTAIKDASGKKLEELFRKYPTNPYKLTYDKQLKIYVDRTKTPV